MILKVRDVLFCIAAILLMAVILHGVSQANTDTKEKDIEDIKNWGDYHLNELCTIVDCANERSETPEEIMQDYMDAWKYIETEMFPRKKPTN